MLTDIPLNMPFKEKIALLRKRRGRELKAAYPEVWDKCIRYAGGVAVNHRLDTSAGADIEDAMIALATELLAYTRVTLSSIEKSLPQRGLT